MFENLCTLPLQADVFTTALHPTEPLLSVGLSSGHVETFRLPPTANGSSDDDSADGDTSIMSDGKGMVDTVWQTRRHKGSCRSLAYSHDGSAAMYSAGTDSIVKHFDSQTGAVISKLAIPSSTSRADAPTLLSEDELLSACFVPGLGPKNNRNNGVVAVGSGTGVVTLWDKGSWDDQQERIIVDGVRRKGTPPGGESVDAICVIPEEMGLGKKIVCGLGDGGLKIGVVSLGFDAGSRLISAGGRTVKVWEELSELQGHDRDEEEGDDSDDDDDDDDSEDARGAKRAAESDSDDSDDSDDDGVEAMKQRAKRRKEAQSNRLGPMGAHGILGFEGMD
ncbi:unnamed protein product [Clonostachys rosea f. rosea IK726]|uniref:Uncharacterized protein n=1 Tax=Clonostachys rosea f. rosea IK726 TaxID=1349383 RepID=A0ACA9TPX0_BIOOC|nr:unnamed protein product [Clonostachys rosea f. rosea IK726]